MTRDQGDDARLTTPLEDAVLEAFITDLKEQYVDDAILDGLSEAFVANKLPTADSLAELIKSESGDKLA
jgi:hypothetical protein